MRRIGIALCSIYIVFFYACERENPYTGSDLDISVSIDTLRFDTVFTTIGSATRTIKIYNNQNRVVSIPEIRLSDEGEHFRMNVDGISGSSIKEAVVQPLDSIYIFAEVTVDPDQPLDISPFIIEEKLIISAGDNEIVVTLEAWGQNANYFPSKSAKGNINLLSCNSQDLVWDDPKPYVIYGVLAIDSCTLIWPEGTRIYVHGGVVRNGESLYNDGLLLFLKDGKLKSQGSPGNPVIIEGDRLEPEFDNLSGQWSGIRFLDESTENIIRHTTIKNAIVGVRVDSLAELEIISSQIYNIASSGIVGVNGIITATNTLIHSTGGAGAQLVYGGDYNFTYCTISNYNNQSQGLIMTNFRCSDAQCLEDIFIQPLKGRLTNCIIDGNGDEEISITDITNGTDPGLFDIKLSYNLIKSVAQNENILFADCNNCFYTSIGDTLFISIDENNYQLDTSSIAEMKALPIPEVPTDILGFTRDNILPDVGCYEFQK